MANNINQTILTAANKNIGFKVGTQAALDTLRTQNAGKNGIPGTFYLTGDTHRLYIANDDKTISPVNPGVITVATLEDLPDMTGATAEVKQATAGNFYYVSGSNILCVYSQSSQAGNEKGGWVQINPNTDNQVASFDQAVSVSNGIATITSTITQGDQGRPNGNLDQSDSITVQGAGGAKVTGSATGITITGEQYSIGGAFSGNTATISLNPTSGYSDSSSSITLSGGNNVTISSPADNSNAFTIASKDTINEVTSVSVATQDATTGNDLTGFKISVTTNNGESGSTDITKSATVNPVITNGDADGFTANFIGGTANLSVYSKEQIDDKLRGLDAMHYRGTMGPGGSVLDVSTPITVSDSLLTSLSVSTGDTFKLAGATTIDNVDYPAGSIVIVRGTEDEQTGLITSGLAFDVIAGSSETDTKYQFNNLADTANPSAPTYSGIQMVEQQNQSVVVGELRINKGTAISLNDSFASNAKAITISHADINPTATTVDGGETQSINGNTTLQVVKSVTANTQGHVTDVKTVEVTLKDSNINLTSADLTPFDVTGGVRIASTVSGVNNMNSTYTTSTTEGNALTITSESLAIAKDATAGANGITMNMVWGSF